MKVYMIKKGNRFFGKNNEYTTKASGYVFFNIDKAREFLENNNLYGVIISTHL